MKIFDTKKYMFARSTNAIRAFSTQLPCILDLIILLSKPTIVAIGT